MVKSRRTKPTQLTPKHFEKYGSVIDQLNQDLKYLNDERFFWLILTTEMIGTSLTYAAGIITSTSPKESDLNYLRGYKEMLESMIGYSRPLSVYTEYNVLINDIKQDLESYFSQLDQILKQVSSKQV